MVSPRAKHFWRSTYIASTMSPIRIIPIVEFKSRSEPALSRYKCDGIVRSMFALLPFARSN